MKVQITSPRNKENLIHAFEEAGAEVTQFLTLDTGLIIPTVDEELPFFAAAKDWFARKGVRVPVSYLQTINVCRNKRSFNSFCLSNGFDIPQEFPPVFVRPVYSKGGRGARQINQDIVQEYLDWPEYSIDYFANYDGTPLSIIPRQRLDIIDGASTKAAINYDPKLVDTADRLGRMLHLIGHNVIQGFYDGKTFKLTEINPRFGGGSHLTFHIFNSPKWLVENL